MSVDPAHVEAFRDAFPEWTAFLFVFLSVLGSVWLVAVRLAVFDASTGAVAAHCVRTRSDTAIGLGRLVLVASITLLGDTHDGWFVVGLACPDAIGSQSAYSLEPSVAWLVASRRSMRGKN